MARCSSCRGFVPASVGSCPNCGTPEAAVGMAGRIGFWLKAAGGASVAMTLMACYGAPYEPEPDTDTDPTEGTSSTTETPPTTTNAESTGGAESTTGGAESTSGGAETTTGAESTGAESTGGSETGGTEGSTGAGSVDERPLPRRAG